MTVLGTQFHPNHFNNNALNIYLEVLVSLFFRGPVAPKKEAKVTATFTATRGRKRNIVVSFISDQLAGVRGVCTINVNR